MFKCLSAWLHSWCMMRISYQCMDPSIQQFTESYADLSNCLGLLWKLLKFHSFLHWSLDTRNSACPSQEWRCSYTKGNYLAYSAKEDTFLFLIFLFLKPKNTSHTNPRYLVFSSFAWFKRKKYSCKRQPFLAWFH